MKTILSILLLTSFSLQIAAQAPIRFQDEESGKYGYKDASDKIIVAAKYDAADEFDNKPYAAVNIGFMPERGKGGKWGIMNEKGKIVIPIQYDAVRYLGYQLFAINKGDIYSNMDATQEGNFAIFNATGKALTAFAYTGFLSSVSFENGYASLQTFNSKTKENKYGLLDSTGKVAVPVIYDDLVYFSEGLAKVFLKGKNGFINIAKKLVIPMKYEGANNFSEGLAAVAENGKWGFIDRKGQWVIPAQYEDAGSFSEGFAGVKQKGKWGVIDKFNKNLHPFIYDGIFLITKGGNDIRVALGKKYLNIDKEGKEIKN